MANARVRKVSKPDAIRAPIKHAGSIKTGEDLIKWVRQANGIGLGLAQRKHRAAQ